MTDIPPATLRKIRDAMDFPPAGADGRVAVAMSGGVDSGVTAYLLKQLGYEVTGLTLRLWEPEAQTAACAGGGLEAARETARRLGAPHETLDAREAFRREVIGPFADSYLRGETPVPCVACNRAVRLPALIRRARELGARALVTGHYVASARLRPESARRGLFIPADLRRDQSYFLCATTQEEADFLRFPLAAFTKPEVRAIAAAAGLPAAAERDSQDICFAPPEGYRAFLARLRPDGAGRAGEIVHVDGRVLGTHEGVAGFTVGQRRGLGVATGEPLYVTEVDARSGRVTVGPREALARAGLRLRALSWLPRAPVPEGRERALAVHVRIRSTRPPRPALLWREEADTAHVRLLRPEHGVSPGQICAIYAGAGPGARLLGGGVIDATK